MFDDVLKGAKARSFSKQRELDSKKNKVEKVEEVKSVSAEIKDIEIKDIDEAITSTPLVAESSEAHLRADEAPKKRNKSGKRTDPSYKQVGAYIRKDTYLQIQKLLLDKPDKDFSDLVQELLSTYLDNQLTD